MLQGAPIPDSDALLCGYDPAWPELTANAPEVMHAKDEDAVSLRKTAQRMLSAYREHIVATHEQSKGVEIIGIEHAERFRLLAYVPPVEMRLDLLELTADGGPGGPGGDVVARSAGKDERRDRVSLIRNGVKSGAIQ